jgi:hypothetical protein
MLGISGTATVSKYEEFVTRGKTGRHLFSCGQNAVDIVFKKTPLDLDAFFQGFQYNRFQRHSFCVTVHGDQGSGVMDQMQENHIQLTPDF